MQKRKILVVDDSALVAEAVRAKLEASNYEVAVAHSGEEALEKVHEAPPDLMILDVYMPGIDGFEVCRRVREDPATQSLPIVMLSSRGNIKEKLAGFRAGADDYLVKEFDLLDLPYRVRLVFRLRGMESERSYTGMGRAIRVLIVDDSPLAAGVLTAILESDPAISVVGVAHDGVEALEQIPRLRPDLVTMDVWMPRLDGFATVEQLMAYYPTPILVVTSSLARSDVDISLTMLAAGALDVIEKPSRVDEATWARACKALIQKVKILSQVRVVTHLKGRHLAGPDAPAATWPAAPERMVGPAPGEPRPEAGQPEGGPGPSGPATVPTPRTRYDLVVIASSTGGPQALLKILVRLPGRFSAPILIVQHIAAGFTQGLASWLAHESGRLVRLAYEGEHPAPGTALLAPDGHHLILRPEGTIGLSDGPPREIRPCADLLMHSVARVHGSRAIGVILTGMGRDGADGLRAMYQAGAYTLAQDEASAIIFGMPQAAISLGAAAEVLPLEGIADRLAALVEG